MQAVFTLAGLLRLLHARHESPLADVVMMGFAVAAAQRRLPARLVEAALSRTFGRWLALKPYWLTNFQSRVLQLHTERWSITQSAAFHLMA